MGIIKKNFILYPISYRKDIFENQFENSFRIFFRKMNPSICFAIPCLHLSSSISQSNQDLDIKEVKNAFKNLILAQGCVCESERVSKESLLI